MQRIDKKARQKSTPLPPTSLNDLPPEVILDIIEQATTILPAQDTVGLLSANRRLRHAGNSANSLKLLQEAYANTDNEMDLEDEILALENKPGDYADRYNQLYTQVAQRFNTDLSPKACRLIWINMKLMYALLTLMMSGLAYMCCPHYRRDEQAPMNRFVLVAAEKTYETAMLSLALTALTCVAWSLAYVTTKLLQVTDHCSDTLIKKPATFFHSPKLNRKYNQQKRLVEFRKKTERTLEEHASPNNKSKLR